MKKTLPYLVLTLALLLAYSLPAPLAMGESSRVDPELMGQPPFAGQGGSWVDSLMAQMGLEEKIAQMIMVYSYSNMGEEHEKAVLKQIRKLKVGGILFFQGEPEEQLRLVGRYQEESQLPLLMGIDGENGLGMRLDSTISYPRAMSLGSIRDDALIYEMGRDMARQFRRCGIHMNMAPVADVNNNPRNPVIGSRSYGSDPVMVAEKVSALVAGMQAERLLVAAKHFPGHGDTDMDSHHALPVIPHERVRLDSVELLPFRRAIMQGLSGIMVAHLEVPALESREKRATTLSAPTITGLLKEEMGFQGLIITDALNMKGLSNYFKPGIREVEAVKAGNDILLMPADPAKAILAIKKAVKRGEITEQRIDESCRKILEAKYWSGLADYAVPEGEELMKDLHRATSYSMIRELRARSLVLLQNRLLTPGDAGDARPLLPLRQLEDLDYATLQISRTKIDLPRGRYLPEAGYYLSMNAGQSQRDSLKPLLLDHDLLLVHLAGHSRRASRAYGLDPEALAWLEELAVEAKGSSCRIVLNLAAHPYALKLIRDAELFDALVLSHDPTGVNLDLVEQVVFGARPLDGRLSVDAGGFRAGDGLRTTSLDRLSYGLPADVGLNADTLIRMEEIIAEAFAEKAIPGCQLLVARRGRVVWNRSYGHHTYRREREVGNGDLYDLASITKMASMTAALLELRDQGLFHEDSLLGSFGVVPAASNKASLRASEVLAHQAGLVAWIPFYYETMEALDPDQELVTVNRSRSNPLKIGNAAFFNRHVRYVEGLYAKEPGPDHPWEVAEDLYLRKDWRDTIFKRIYDSELRETEPRYSGLGFYIFHQIVEEVTDTSLNDFVWKHFYAPLGARSLGYRPLERFEREQIVPTENDIIYRRQLLQGHVHDMGAAMLGGVSGNAGLFGNANDLAKLMQMFLNGGSYGGRRYLSEEGLERFTARYDDSGENARGLGFNKAVYWEMDAGPACDSASKAGFGHSGFTGTLAWADPEHELVFVFLSNRVHPDMGNSKLLDMDIRTGIQQVVYDALKD